MRQGHAQPQAAVRELAPQIDEMWDSGSLDPGAIEEAIALLDAGTIRVAEPSADGWVVNEWVK